MKKFTILLIILLVLTQFSITAVSDTGKNTIYVDDDNTSGPWEGTQDCPFQHIQDGIDSAEPGDTVYVYGGFYNEQILINKTLNLQGESMEDTIIDGTGLGRLCTIEETDNVVVSGFTFQNAEHDVEALYITHSTPVVIEQNRFIDNEGLPIYLGGSNNIVQENEIINNNQGANTVWVVSSRNTLLNNTIENNKGCGISILVGNNLIKGNIIKDNGEYGVFLANYMSVTNTVISDNLIQGSNIGIYVPLFPIYTVITNNTIRDNTKAGIMFHSDRSTFSYNIIENSSIGLSLRSDGFSNTISHNTFSSNSVGIQTIGTISNTFTENNFIKNTIHATFFNYVPFYLYPDDDGPDLWDNNYWDNWKINLPKPILGLQAIILYVGIIPYCLFDRNPASEPFGLEA